MKKRSKWLVGLLATGSLLAFSACGAKESDGGSETNDTVKDEATELSVSVWGYDANPEFKAMFDAFEDKNPNVKIKVVDIAADQYENKVTTMLAGGDTTDVLGMKDVGSYVNYANKGQLVDLTGDIEGLSEEDLANYKGNLDGYKTEEEKYFAMPFRKEIYMMFYNKGIFDEAGVEYPGDLTWDEYEKLAADLTSGEADNKVYGTYYHTWYPLVQALAANQTGNDLMSGKYDFLADYYDRVLRLQNEGHAMDYATIKTTSTTYSSVFETGKTATMIMGSFYLGKLINSINTNNLELEWGVTTLPQNEKGEIKTYGGPTGFAVSNHSKNKNLATEFVKFCAGEEGAKAVSSIGMTTAYQSDTILDILANVEGMPQDEQFKKALQPDHNGWELLARPEAAAINTILGEEHDLIMVQDNTVEKGIKEMTKRIKTEVE